MSHCLLHAPYGIGTTPLIFAAVGITVLMFDERRIHRQSTNTERIRLSRAIRVSDARFRFIVLEPSRRFDNLFELLEIYVHIQKSHIR